MLFPTLKQLATPTAGGARLLAPATAALLAGACGDATGVSPTAPPPPPTDMVERGLEGIRLWVPPTSNAREQANLWRASRPADAALMERIAAQPQARWFGDWNRDIGAAVQQTVGAAATAGAVPVLVAYNIPQRDCGGLSGGGGATPEEYRRWILSFAAGLGELPAIVILEPDAAALTDCLTPAERDHRFELLRFAVETLAATPRALVYIDAGHPRWHPPAETARRLRLAGIGIADGFALNVSNFFTTQENVRYGSEVSARVNGKRFVIDTSRNGRGPTPDLQWCNPTGRSLGEPPTTRPPDPHSDAYLWIKAPGESDGTCNGGPPAGAWWPEYALALAENASL